MLLTGADGHVVDSLELADQNIGLLQRLFVMEIVCAYFALRMSAAVSSCCILNGCGCFGCSIKNLPSLPLRLYLLTLPAQAVVDDRCDHKQTDDHPCYFSDRFSIFFGQADLTYIYFCANSGGGRNTGTDNAHNFLLCMVINFYFYCAGAPSIG
jgi:hypothetical protein